MKRHTPAIWIIVAWMGLLPLPCLHGQCPMSTAEVIELEQQYHQGRFQSILDLGGCVDQLLEATRSTHKPTLDMLNATERFIHIYLLAAYAMDRLDLAEITLPAYIQRFPRFEANPNLDPAQMILDLDSLIAYPLHELGAWGGPQLCMVQALNPQSLRYDLDGEFPTEALPTYHHRFGYQLGIQYTHHLGYRHGLRAAFAFNRQVWAARYGTVETDDEGAGTLGDWIIYATDHYNLLRLPLSYQFRTPLGNPKDGPATWLQLEVGVYGTLLVHGETSLENYVWSRAAGDSLSQDAQPILTIGNPIERRTRGTVGGLAAVGFQMDFDRFSWFLRIQGQYGLTQMRSLGSEYHDDFVSHLFEYQLVDNNFRLHTLGLETGISLRYGSKVKDIRKR